MSSQDSTFGQASTGAAAKRATSPTPAEKPDAPDGIGEALVKAGVINSQQLQRARRIQYKLPDARTLISILEEMRLASSDQIREALKANPVPAPVGELLVEFGHVKKSDLRMALSIQQERPTTKIGAILIENHFVGSDQLVETLSIQLGFERLDPRNASPDLELLQPAKWLRSNELFPVGRRNGLALIAFADPQDFKQVEAARRVFGADMVIGIAGSAEINEAIDRTEALKVKPVAQVIGENVIVETVDQILGDAVESNASDIHIEPQKGYLRIRFRQDGVLMNHKDLPADMAAPFISRLKVLAKADIAEKRRHQDGRILHSYKGAPIDLRVSTYVSIHGETVVLRLLSTLNQVLAIGHLGMGPRMLHGFVEDSLDAPSGVVIVTGPTGSGKTTTLYSAVNYLNNPRTSIITAEDPVEYLVDGITQCSINPRIGLTYEDTLKHIVRQDPDVIVIGEIRDNFSAETAIQAALTGHKVLTTFHTEDSIGGLVRLLNMHIEAFLISSTVVSVLAQRLVRRVCPHCAETHTLGSHQLRRLGYELKDLLGQNFKIGRGCKQCRFMGYKGRIAVFELLVLNELVKDAVIAQKSSYDIRRLSIESTGLVTLLEDAIHKGLEGLTTYDEIIRQIPRLGKPRPINEIRRLLGEVQ